MIRMSPRHICSLEKAALGFPRGSQPPAGLTSTAVEKQEEPSLACPVSVRVHAAKGPQSQKVISPMCLAPPAGHQEHGLQVKGGKQQTANRKKKKKKVGETFELPSGSHAFHPNSHSPELLSR